MRSVLSEISHHARTRTQRIIIVEFANRNRMRDKVPPERAIVVLAAPTPPGVEISAAAASVVMGRTAE